MTKISDKNPKIASKFLRVNLQSPSTAHPVPELNHFSIKNQPNNQVNFRDALENIAFKFVRVENRQVELHKPLRKAVIQVSHAESVQFKSSTDSIPSLLNFIQNHVRFKQLAKDKKIEHLKLPRTPKRTILSSKENPCLPKQTINKLRDSDNIVEITVFP